MYADCNFVVTNNSATPVTVEAGFFNNSKITFSVPEATVMVKLIKSNYNCTEVTQSSLGITFVNLVGNKSSGGWVYDPASKMIRANGYKAASSSGRIGNAPNGLQIFLANNTRPQKDDFRVEIKNIERNVSRQLGSMD